jgi:hypothetical protein
MKFLILFLLNTIIVAYYDNNSNTTIKIINENMFAIINNNMTEYNVNITNMDSNKKEEEKEDYFTVYKGIQLKLLNIWYISKGVEYDDNNKEIALIVVNDLEESEYIMFLNHQYYFMTKIMHHLSHKNKFQNIKYDYDNIIFINNDEIKKLYNSFTIK